MGYPPPPGYPQPGLRGVPKVGYPLSGYLRWGTPCQGTPQPGPMRGKVSEVGHPPLGYPPARSDGGIPRVGYPPSRGTPLAGPGRGTPPPTGVDRQMDGWMDGQTCVKTLPSRRITYEVGNNHGCVQSSYHRRLI